MVAQSEFLEKEGKWRWKRSDFQEPYRVLIGGWIRESWVICSGWKKLFTLILIAGSREWDHSVLMDYFPEDFFNWWFDESHRDYPRKFGRLWALIATIFCLWGSEIGPERSESSFRLRWYSDFHRLVDIGLQILKVALRAFSCVKSKSMFRLPPVSRIVACKLALTEGEVVEQISPTNWDFWDPTIEVRTKSESNDDLLEENGPKL